MSAYELAQLNIAIMKAPLESPRMADFVANLDRINALAESSPGFAECEQKPNDCNTGPVKDGGSITILSEKSIQDWNTISADGNTLDTSMITNGVYPIPFFSKPNGDIGWNQDLLVEEPKLLKNDPQTWEYKIKPEAVWSDGTPITVKDFQYHWKVANGTDCPLAVSRTSTQRNGGRPAAVTVTSPAAVRPNNVASEANVTVGGAGSSFNHQTAATAATITAINPTAALTVHLPTTNACARPFPKRSGKSRSRRAYLALRERTL